MYTVERVTRQCECGVDRGTLEDRVLHPRHTPATGETAHHSSGQVCLCLGCQCLEVSHALLEGGSFLGGGDGGLDAVHDPVHHVLLLQPRLDVGHLQLVVQTLLDLDREGRTRRQ